MNRMNRSQRTKIFKFFGNTINAVKGLDPCLIFNLNRDVSARRKAGRGHHIGKNISFSIFSTSFSLFQRIVYINIESFPNNYTFLQIEINIQIQGLI